MTWHFVSGAYLENLSTDFNHITHISSPYTLDVPLGVDDLNEGQKKVQEGCECCDLVNHFLFRFLYIYRKLLNIFQPYYMYILHDI
jgi:hypothetical protein